MVLIYYAFLSEVACPSSDRDPLMAEKHNLYHKASDISQHSLFFLRLNSIKKHIFKNIDNEQKKFSIKIIGSDNIDLWII